MLKAGCETLKYAKEKKNNKYAMYLDYAWNTLEIFEISLKYS